MLALQVHAEEEAAAEYADHPWENLFLCQSLFYAGSFLLNDIDRELWLSMCPDLESVDAVITFQDWSRFLYFCAARIMPIVHDPVVLHFLSDYILEIIDDHVPEEVLDRDPLLASYQYTPGHVYVITGDSNTEHRSPQCASLLFERLVHYCLA